MCLLPTTYIRSVFKGICQSVQGGGGGGQSTLDHEPPDPPQVGDLPLPSLG